MAEKVKKKKKHTVLIVSLVVLVGLIVVGVGVGVGILLKKTIFMSYPELKGEPEVGQWYQVAPEGTISSNGTEWHGIFRKGKENKVVVYFFGGGVSITPETSKQGTKFFAVDMTAQNFVAQGGIGSTADGNPFKDWSFIIIPYASGDFHTGTGEYRYTENGKEQTVYHHGYTNYAAMVETVKQYIGEPDTLLVTGFSAGGFATSLLADDVIDRFPSANNVTVCVDSSLLLYDGWHETAQDLWESPTEITERFTTDNIVLDSLTALYNKRGDSVKILFDCSYRDDTLQQYQGYINNGKMENNKANGDRFQADLKEMVAGLQANIPEVGIYIWNYKADAQTNNTQHTIISSDFLVELESGKSIADWLSDAVNGTVRSYGLDLLNK